MSNLIEGLVPPDIQPLGEVCRRNAARWPENVAMWDGERQITWHELDRNAARVAHGLAALGVQPGHRVAAIGRTSIEMFELVHGTAWLGAVFTGINWRLNPGEVAYIVNDSEAQVLFVDEHMLQSVLSVREQLHRIKAICVLGSAAPEGTFAYEEWRNAQMDNPINRRIDPAEPTTQVYTSGTTGRPKGAVLSHRYWMAAAELNAAQRHDSYGMKVGEVILHHFPMFHIGGVGLHYYPAIRGGGIAILKEYNTGEVLRLMAKHRVPLLYGVPTMFQDLLNDERFPQADFSNVRYCGYGAAPMPIALRDRLMKIVPCMFVQRYGMTESAFVTTLDPEDHLGDVVKAKSVGRPLVGVEVRILDSDGDELPTGKAGEVAIRTPLMMDGYWKLPDETRKAFRDGWYMTGDGGYLDGDGYLFLTDRIKDLIISGGENISSIEIENVLYEHPSVLKVAVVAAPDERWGEVPKAFIVVKSGQEFSPESLHAFAATRLGKYKLPKYYEEIDELPLNASGKILKRELRTLGNEHAVRV